MDAASRRQLLVDEVEALTKQIEVDGLVVVGSKGQPVLHPAVTARHAALESIRRLDAASPPEPPGAALDALLDADQ